MIKHYEFSCKEDTYIDTIGPYVADINKKVLFNTFQVLPLAGRIKF